MKGMRLGMAAMALVAILGIAVGTAGAAKQGAKRAKGGPPEVNKVILFASDGMRPDLVDKYAAQAMPTMRELMKHGVKGQNGLLQGFPPNTGVGWYTLATGTWPGEHGSTNNTFHRTGEGNFNNSHGFATTGVLQADTHRRRRPSARARRSSRWSGSARATSCRRSRARWSTSARSSRTAACCSTTTCPGSRPARTRSASPTSGSTSIAARRLDERPGVVQPGEAGAAHADEHGVPGADNVDPRLRPLHLRLDQRRHDELRPRARRPADRRQERRAGRRRPRRGRVGRRQGDADRRARRPDRRLLRQGDRRSRRTCRSSASTSPRSRASNATYNALGAAGSAALRGDARTRLPDLDGGRLRAARGRHRRRGHVRRAGPQVEGRALRVPPLHPRRPRLARRPADLGTPTTDEFQHQFMGLVTPTDIDGDPNPYYDDLTNDNVPDGRVAIREGYIRSAYHEADETLELGRELMGGRPDRRSSPPTTASRRSGTRSTRARCSSTPGSRAPSRSATAAAARSGTTRRATRWPRRAGPAAPRRSTSTSPAATRRGHIRQVPAANYETVRNQIIAAFQNLTDPANPGKQVVLKIMKKEELRNVDGTDSLHPSRSGDVVVVLRPPYQFDAATPGQRIAFSQFFGQHGYLPNLVDIAAQRQHARDVHRRRAGHPQAGRPSRACARSTSRRRSRS